MKANLILADAATAHPDGTVSMLRAGITHIWGEQVPVGLRATLVVRIESDLGDTGDHKFDLQCVNDDGRETMGRIEGTFTIRDGTVKAINNLILNFATQFDALGRFTFIIRVDNLTLDSYGIYVQRPAEGQSR